MPQPQPLTFEQFVERISVPTVEDSPLSPRYNNFHLNFDTVGWGVLYEPKSHVQRFKTENPDLEKRLSESLAIRDRSVGSMESLKPFERDMYEAYLIMRGYDGVSDEDLFE